MHALLLNKQMAFCLRHLDSDEPKIKKWIPWGFLIKRMTKLQSCKSVCLLNYCVRTNNFYMISIPCDASCGGCTHEWIHSAVVCSIGLGHKPRSGSDKLEAKRPTTYGAWVYGITQLTRWLRKLLIYKMFRLSMDTDCDAWREAHLLSIHHPIKHTHLMCVWLSSQL